MKAKLIAVTLLLMTAGAVVLYPYVETSATSRPAEPVVPSRHKVEVVFVLDTTGSMGGLIATAKEKIWSIATTLAQAEQSPEIRMGLVAYRDRGDAYVTDVVDLSSDLDTMYGRLMQYAADGGGDTPESVNQALHDAVHRISWSQDPSSYQVIFLVGDAPPHMDYQGEAPYPEIVRAAAASGIVVNTIQCGEMPQTVAPWTEIARLGNGGYLKVEQAGGAFAVSTPFDNEIARLSAELDETRLFYGSVEQMAQLDGKLAATAELEAIATTGSRVRRAVFNATESGRTNLFGDQDLVENVTQGEVALDDVPEEELPESIRGLDRAEQEKRIEELAGRREALQSRIDALAESRAAFIDERVAEEGGAEDSLDRQIYDIVVDQAAPAGLSFEKGPEF
ncbi:MAG TPA: vWA domain-containing protein [Gammaproteobacteria bacterium]|nr:vWA domain-containing protein [Gammaproteobacteria bacterium]